SPTIPTGSVNSPTGQGRCILSAGVGVSANCTIEYTPSTMGTETLAFSYDGDAVHQASSASFDLTVAKRAVSVLIACNSTSFLVNQPVSCKGTVEDNSNGTAITPTGILKFT